MPIYIPTVLPRLTTNYTRVRPLLVLADSQARRARAFGELPMTEITINADQTLTVKWSGRKGHGSLFQIMADGNAKLVNQLSREDLALVMICVGANPFPVPGLNASREKTLEAARKALAEMQTEFAGLPELGEFRREMVRRAGDSCNGPTDGYLKWFVEQKRAVAV